MQLDKFRDRSQISKALLRDDIIDLGTRLNQCDSEDVKWIRMHLRLDHSRIIRLAQSCPDDRIEDARRALNNFGYIYRFVFDVAHSEHYGYVEPEPIPSNYGRLAAVTNELLGRGKVKSSWIFQYHTHAIIMHAKQELEWILNSDGADSRYILDSMVLNDELIRDMVGWDTLFRYWNRIASRHVWVLYTWIKNRQEYVDVIQKYLDKHIRIYPHLGYDVDISDHIGESGRCAIYILYNRHSTMIVEDETITLLNSDISIGDEEPIQMNAALTSLYEQMPTAFKELNMTEMERLAALQAFYYMRHLPALSNYISHHNIDMAIVDSKVEPINKTYEKTAIVTEAIHAANINNCYIKGAKICYDATSIQIGGLSVPHTGTGIVTIDLRDTIHRHPGIVTLDFDRGICSYPEWMRSS